MGFGALLLGVHAQGRLQYAGNVGTGFSQQTLKDIKKALDARSQPRSPFPPNVRIEGKPQWVIPTLVAEVSFGEWTRAGRVRHAVFRGLRVDKDASAVVREAPLRLSVVKGSPGGPADKPHAPSTRLHVTNPQRVVDASTGITKIALVRYYDLVGDLMVRHLSSRPVSLVRAPDGVGGALFFQKHAQTEKLPGIRQLDPALSAGSPPMLAVAGKQGLLSAVQWNVIEFHTLNAGPACFKHPDRMVFDLDPGAGVPWAQVQEAAQLMHAFLAELGLASFLKTSGGKGLHVVVPLRRLHDWDTVKGFSRAVVLHVARTIPQRFVARSGPKNRVGRIFIDYLRNNLGATTVCAWSARARPGLGISVPVAWDELPSLRGGDHWSVQTVHQRLDSGNAPWNGYARAARGQGIKQDDGDYVILTEEQIKAAYPTSTQTIEIESFVKASEIPFTLLETPYYLEPLGKGEKVYALLREAMAEAGVIGIARVVMHTKEHLAALIPSGAALVLNTIRWASEIRAVDELKLPAQGKTAAGLKPTELKMAAQLISDMTGPWKSADYSDRFGDAVQELVNKKVAAGETETVTPLEDAPAQAGTSNVVDLTELLAKSLAKRKPVSAATTVATAARKPAPKATARKRV